MKTNTPTNAELAALFLDVIVILLAYQNSEITLTNKRLIYRTGFVARAAGELPLENVEAIFILEPLLGRLLGYGTVTVSSFGGLRLPLQYLSKPHVFHAALQNAVTGAKAASRPAQKVAPPSNDDSRTCQTPLKPPTKPRVKNRRLLWLALSPESPLGSGPVIFRPHILHAHIGTSWAISGMM